MSSVQFVAVPGESFLSDVFRSSLSFQTADYDESDYVSFIPFLFALKHVYFYLCLPRRTHETLSNANRQSKRPNFLLRFGHRVWKRGERAVPQPNSLERVPLLSTRVSESHVVFLIMLGLFKSRWGHQFCRDDNYK